MYLTSRGLTTSPMPHPTGPSFQIDLDLVDHRLDVTTVSGGRRSLDLVPRSVADFHAAVMSLLDELGVGTDIWPVPVEIPGAIPFPTTRCTPDDADAVHRFWLAPGRHERVVKRFRARFLGKASPIHLFWGALDLATPASRAAPRAVRGGVPNCGPHVMRRRTRTRCRAAASGRAPGEEGTFYAYAYPTARLPGRAGRAGGRVGRRLGEFVLPTRWSHGPRSRRRAARLPAEHLRGGRRRRRLGSPPWSGRAATGSPDAPSVLGWAACDRRHLYRSTDRSVGCKRRTAPAAPPAPPAARTRLTLGKVRTAFSPVCYRRSTVRALAALAFDLVLFVAAVVGAIVAPHPVLTLACGVLAGTAAAFLFVWGHDAAHGALFSSDRVAEVLGTVAMLPSLNMYRLWLFGHNKVHHGFTSLSSIDWIWRPLTVEEYRAGAVGSARLPAGAAPVTCAPYLLRVWWPGMVQFRPDPGPAGSGRPHEQGDLGGLRPGPRGAGLVARRPARRVRRRGGAVPGVHLVHRLLHLPAPHPPGRALLRRAAGVERPRRPAAVLDHHPLLVAVGAAHPQHPRAHPTTWTPASPSPAAPAFEDPPLPTATRSRPTGSVVDGAAHLRHLPALRLRRAPLVPLRRRRPSGRTVARCHRRVARRPARARPNTTTDQSGTAHAPRSLAGPDGAGTTSTAVVPAVGSTKAGRRPPVRRHGLSTACSTAVTASAGSAANDPAALVGRGRPARPTRPPSGTARAAHRAPGQRTARRRPSARRGGPRGRPPGSLRRSGGCSTPRGGSRRWARPRCRRLRRTARRRRWCRTRAGWSPPRARSRGRGRGRRARRRSPPPRPGGRPRTSPGRPSGRSRRRAPPWAPPAIGRSVVVDERHHARPSPRARRRIDNASSPKMVS